ncbi:MAG TPA: hypothetical protein VMP67_11125 [Candidatus Limnocylindria bacterium]|nr:hypothetical protein [Candidatus Limnocylindria bacterium]
MVELRQLVNRNLPPVERACLSKARFLSRREAGALARQGRLTARDVGGQLAPYHCLYCGWWHLGHRLRRQRGRRRATL